MKGGAILRKKQFDKDFEFVLNKKQKNHLIDKSNALTVSGAEYIRLLIEQDILLEELKTTKEKSIELSNKLLAVQDKLKRKDKP